MLNINFLALLNIMFFYLILCSFRMMHPRTHIVMLCRRDFINFGTNEVDIKQLEASDINNSLYKDLLNDS